jgi:hypothetical protein
MAELVEAIGGAKKDIADSLLKRPNIITSILYGFSF